MVYIPKNRGGGNTYHDEWANTPHGSNSPNGAALAVKHGKGWLDNDATRTSDDVLINDHGRPLRAYFHGPERSCHFPWSQSRGRVYVYHHHVFHLRSIAAALADNARHKVRGKPVGTEVEVKNLRPITEVRLGAIMEQLAKDAEAAYGPEWRHYVIVKVLTDLLAGRAGLAYALEVCRAAHAAGVPTMLLPRGAARYLRFRGHTEITYIRGSAVIRR